MDPGVEVLRAELAGSAAERAAAFTQLLDRCLDRSFRLAAVILGNRPDAEDALVDASLRAWQHVGSLRDPDRFEAWFSRIVVNVCRDRLHRRRLPEVLVTEPRSPGDGFAQVDERAALRQALAALSPEHRAVIALHYLEEQTVEQIAAQLGIRTGTVKSRLHYGVAELRAAYDAAQREPAGMDR
ncbi:MAG: RNA polymerase sigma factor [Candidatus Limnocylindrales bacterium]